MMFSIEFSSDAKKFLKKADKQFMLRLIARIERLSEDPFPSDVKRIVNQNEKLFRIRVGDYRIVYEVIYEQNLIFIFDIDKRSKVYD